MLATSARRPYLAALLVAILVTLSSWLPHGVRRRQPGNEPGQPAAARHPRRPPGTRGSDRSPSTAEPGAATRHINKPRNTGASRSTSSEPVDDGSDRWRQGRRSTWP